MIYIVHIIYIHIYVLVFYAFIYQGIIKYITCISNIHLSVILMKIYIFQEIHVKWKLQFNLRNAHCSCVDHWSPSLLLLMVLPQGSPLTSPTCVLSSTSPTWDWTSSSPSSCSASARCRPTSFVSGCWRYGAGRSPSWPRLSSGDSSAS